MRWLEDQDTPWNAFQTALDAESLGRVGSWLNLVGNWLWPRRCDKVKCHAFGYRGPKADPALPNPCAVAEEGDNGAGVAGQGQKSAQTTTPRSAESARSRCYREVLGASRRQAYCGRDRRGYRTRLGH